MRRTDSPDKRLHDLVMRRPGITLHEALTSLGIGWSTLYRAIHKLKSEGSLGIERHPGIVLLHPARAPPGHTSLTAIVRTERARKIAALIVSEPGQHTCASLAQRTGTVPRVVTYNVRRLVEARVVTSSLPTRYAGLTPSQELVAFVKQHRFEKLEVPDGA